MQISVLQLSFIFCEFHKYYPFACLPATNIPTNSLIQNPHKECTYDEILYFYTWYNVKVMDKYNSQHANIIKKLSIYPRDGSTIFSIKSS